MTISRLVSATRWKGSSVSIGTISEARASAAAGQRLTVRYFAWVREKVGRAEEVVDVPQGVATVGDLVAAAPETLADLFLVEPVRYRDAHQLPSAFTCAICSGSPYL